jgi:hypothetical protein
MQDRCSEYFKGLVLLGGYALGLKLSRQPASASFLPISQADSPAANSVKSANLHRFLAGELALSGALQD